MLDTLRRGLTWLYDTEQVDGALIQHHGVTLPPVDGRTYTFTPAGWNSRPVIVVRIAPSQDPVRARIGELESRRPLRVGELEELSALLVAEGHPVDDVWNGHPGQTGSVGLARPAHPSLIAAVNRYLAGCPTHSTVFCGCGWYSAGYDLLTLPS